LMTTHFNRGTSMPYRVGEVLSIRSTGPRSAALPSTNDASAPVTLLVVHQDRTAWLLERSMSSQDRFSSFADFYPFYLSEHSNRVSRWLHFAGTSIALALLGIALLYQTWWPVAAAFVQGFAFAWVGHFFFEHNKPATFKYPAFSFMGDCRLWWDMVTGKIPF